MALKVRYQLMDAVEMRQTLEAMALELLKLDADPLVILLGIERRGGPLAHRLAETLRASGVQVVIGKLDINLYRDDLTTVAAQPIVRRTELPEIHDHRVVLVDDVLYTGRTVRAAMEALNDYGRVKAVRLAVLVDRGGRELPIEPDVVGRTIDLPAGEIAEVRVSEIDDEEGVWIMERG